MPVAGLQVDDRASGWQRAHEADAVGIGHRLQRDVVLAQTGQHRGLDVGAGVDTQADLAAVDRHVADLRARLA